jgi:hypothetical protein
MIGEALTTNKDVNTMNKSTINDLTIPYQYRSKCLIEGWQKDFATKWKTSEVHFLPQDPSAPMYAFTFWADVSAGVKVHVFHVMIPRDPGGTPDKNAVVTLISLETNGRSERVAMDTPWCFTSPAFDASFEDAFGSLELVTGSQIVSAIERHLRNSGLKPNPQRVK